MVAHFGETETVDILTERGTQQSYITFLGDVNEQTINSYLRGYRAFGNFCEEEGFIEGFKSPIKEVDPPVKQVYTYKELRALTIKPNIENFEEYRNYLAILLILATGARAYSSKSNVFLDVPKVVFGGTVIGEYACYNCNNVKEVEILDSVTYIGYDAFALTEFESITIPSGVKSISKLAFYLAKLKNLELCNGIETIGYNAFYGCPITLLHIPASIKSITGECFYGRLEYITADKNNETYYSINNCLIKKSNKELVIGTLNSIIPSDGSVTSIGSYAFYYSQSETVVIPEGVTSIEAQAFFHADKMSSIVISNTVTGVRRCAFDQCSALKTVYYYGSAEQENDLSVHREGNMYFKAAERYYYSETQPAEEGNYWRYVDGIPVAW